MAKKPGFMLYFEDYASLRETLSADELVSVLDAMSNYSETGALPDEAALSEPLAFAGVLSVRSSTGMRACMRTRLKSVGMQQMHAGQMVQLM